MLCIISSIIMTASLNHWLLVHSDFLLFRPQLLYWCAVTWATELNKKKSYCGVEFCNLHFKIGSELSCAAPHNVVKSVLKDHWFFFYATPSHILKKFSTSIDICDSPYLALEGILLSPCPIWIRFCQLIFFQKFPNFFGGENWHQSGYFDTLSSSWSFIKVAPWGL